MSITVKEAANAVGMSKAAIFKAIRNGKISAEKNPNGEWRIEPVELFRVFEPVHSVHSNGHPEVRVGQHPENDGTQPVYTPSVETLQVTVTQLEMRLQEMTEAKDALIAAKDDTIGDLRARLNIEQEERRRLSMMLTATASTPTPPAPLAQEPKPKGWWQRLLGGQ